MTRKPISDELIKLSSFNLNLMTIFGLIYTTRSVTEAANILNISRPAISQSLRKLRLHFEDPLFIRHGNTLSPTVFSDDLYRKTENSIKSMSDFLCNDSSVNNQETLSVYSPFYVFAYDYMLKNISSQKFKYKIKYYETNFDIPSTVDLLNYRKADIVLSSGPVSQATLNCIKIKDIELELVCSKNNTWGDKLVTEEDFTTFELITYLTSDDIMNFHKQNFSSEIKAVNSIVETNSLLFLLSTVSNTQCFTFLSKNTFDSFGEIFNLRRLNYTFATPKIEAYIVYRKEMDKQENFRLLMNDFLGR
ncbi:LysR family transcriptional regulator [Yersinia massiliensis]|uniref:LysR family transcriptional regulator n=1 Tax=Yersinia massiliensis TaxID=419257 RepID=UPI0002F8F97C|nr:LysR family transcriptional regulator [Yersinia massiliensis]